MSLLALRTAIVDAVKTAIPAIVDCQPHGGRLDKEEISKIAMRTPAVRIGCLGIRSMETDGAGGIDVTAVWGLFVITTDKPQLGRDAGSLVLLSAIAPVVPDNTWGDLASGYPENLRGDNLYSGSLNGAGVALWAITWQQKITLGGLDPSTLDDFITFSAGYDFNQDGQADAADQVTLEQ